MLVSRGQSILELHDTFVHGLINLCHVVQSNFNLSLMIGLLLISRMINQFKFISSSRLSRWTKKTGITG